MRINRLLTQLHKKLLSGLVMVRLYIIKYKSNLQGFENLEGLIRSYSKCYCSKRKSLYALFYAGRLFI